jgi:hypothetical protein
MSGQVLLDAIVATAATKVPFTLTMRDFAGSSLPSLKSSGLGAGDTVLIWEWVNGDWTDTGITLSSTAGSRSRTIGSPGRYAVTAVLVTAGPVSCELNTATRS